MRIPNRLGTQLSLVVLCLSSAQLSCRICTDQTLLFGGLARLDILYSLSPVFATTFTYLQPHTIFASRADELLVDLYSGNPSNILTPPTGTPARLQSYPHLQSALEFEFLGVGRRNALDVAISGIGWISLGGVKNDRIRVRVSTPNGWGVAVRDAPMLPILKWRTRKFKNLE